MNFYSIFLVLSIASLIHEDGQDGISRRVFLLLVTGVITGYAVLSGHPAWHGLLMSACVINWRVWPHKNNFLALDGHDMRSYAGVPIGRFRIPPFLTILTDLLTCAPDITVKRLTPPDSMAWGALYGTFRGAFISLAPLLATLWNPIAVIALPLCLLEGLVFRLFYPTSSTKGPDIVMGLIVGLIIVICL